MTQCPICRTETSTKWLNTPYWTCPNCSCWFQWPQPSKTYIAPFEGDPSVMSDGDRQVNRELAAKLFQNVMGGKPGRTLDIGAKLPVFAEALSALGCDAWGLDHEDFRHRDSPVRMILEDFETFDSIPEGYPETWDFISLIHTFEHLYDPIKAIQKLRSLVSEEGAVFIRMPDHSVAGIGRDLTDGHFSIHPFVHSISSVLQCLVETKDTFVVTDSWILDGYGQRDLILRPIWQTDGNT